MLCPKHIGPKPIGHLHDMYWILQHKATHGKKCLE